MHHPFPAQVLCAAPLGDVDAAVDRANGTKLDVLVAAPADARVGLARLVSTHAAAKTHHWALALVFESERNCKVAHHFLMEKRALARERRRSALRAQLAAVATPEGGGASLSGRGDI